MECCDGAKISDEIAGPFGGGRRLGKERRRLIHVKPDIGWGHGRFPTVERRKGVGGGEAGGGKTQLELEVSG